MQHDPGLAHGRVSLCRVPHGTNTLRLWRAEAPESFDVSIFNRGEYYGAVQQKIASENLSKVLYPNDEQLQGKELRLEQQYFFVACSLQDMLRILKLQKIPLENFHGKFAVQLNDTHPAIAVAELMRLLVDEHGLRWSDAWSITRQTFAYTNHTLLPEALEQWPLALFARILPRHLEIVFEINARFLDQVRAEPDEVPRLVAQHGSLHGAPREVRAVLYPLEEIRDLSARAPRRPRRASRRMRASRPSPPLIAPVDRTAGAKSVPVRHAPQAGGGA